MRLYGLAAGMVFGDVFFPEATPLVALLASFATYSVGLRRAADRCAGVRLDRRSQRPPRVVLITTVALMGLSPTLIGLIRLCQIGVWAPTCLVIPALRAGVRAGAGTVRRRGDLAEYAPAKRRGLVASIIAIGSNSGTLLASLVWLLVLQLDEKI